MNCLRLIENRSGAESIIGIYHVVETAAEAIRRQMNDSTPAGSEYRVVMCDETDDVSSGQTLYETVKRDGYSEINYHWENILAAHERFHDPCADQS